MIPVHVVITPDEANVRYWAEVFGHAVEIYHFTSGQQAFEQFTQAQAPVDLIVAMPDDGGFFAMSPSRLASALCDGVLSRISHFADTKIICVGDDESYAVSAGNDRVASVHSLDEAIRFVQFGELAGGLGDVPGEPAVEQVVRASADEAHSTFREHPSRDSFDFMDSFASVDSLIADIWADKPKPQVEVPPRSIDRDRVAAKPAPVVQQAQAVAAPRTARLFVRDQIVDEPAPVAQHDQQAQQVPMQQVPMQQVQMQQLPVQPADIQASNIGHPPHNGHPVHGVHAPQVTGGGPALQNYQVPDGLRSDNLDQVQVERLAAMAMGLSPAEHLVVDWNMNAPVSRSGYHANHSAHGSSQPGAEVWQTVVEQQRFVPDPSSLQLNPANLPKAGQIIQPTTQTIHGAAAPHVATSDPLLAFNTRVRDAMPTMTQQVAEPMSQQHTGSHQPMYFNGQQQHVADLVGVEVAGPQVIAPVGNNAEQSGRRKRKGRSGLLGGMRSRIAAQEKSPLIPSPPQESAKVVHPAGHSIGSGALTNDSSAVSSTGVAPGLMSRMQLDDGASFG